MSHHDDDDDNDDDDNVLAVTDSHHDNTTYISLVCITLEPITVHWTKLAISSAFERMLIY